MARWCRRSLGKSSGPRRGLEKFQKLMAGPLSKKEQLEWTGKNKVAQYQGSQGEKKFQEGMDDNCQMG